MCKQEKQPSGAKSAMKNPYYELCNCLKFYLVCLAFAFVCGMCDVHRRQEEVHSKLSTGRGNIECQVFYKCPLRRNNSQRNSVLRFPPPTCIRGAGGFSGPKYPSPQRTDRIPHTDVDRGPRAPSCCRTPPRGSPGTALGPSLSSARSFSTARAGGRARAAPLPPVCD